MKALKVFSKPYFDWTKEEQENLPTLIQTLIDGGVEIIKLGDKRCFFCGIPLGSPSGLTKTIRRSEAGKKPLLITNLCDDCWGKTQVHTL